MLWKNSSVAAMALLAASPALRAQLTAGILQGIVTDAQGRALSGQTIQLNGSPASFTVLAHSQEDGRFALVLPPGAYRSTPPNDFRIVVRPLMTTCVKLVVDESSGAINAASQACPHINDQPWAAQPQEPASSISKSLHGMLLATEPTTVALPLDLWDLSSMRLPLLSQNAFSWTDVHYTLQGMDASDPYQPGRVVAFPDLSSMSDVVLREDFTLAASPAYGSEVASFIRAPSSEWHGELSSADTAALLASGNLPGPATRGALQQSEHFRWFTHDSAQMGGPLGDRGDFMAAATGQWASQTVAQAPLGSDLNSRLLFGNVRGRVQLTPKDQLEGLFSGSRINLSNWAVPAGLEALIGRRMSPSFTNPAGFAGEGEADHLDFLQTAWNRQLPAAHLEVRYAFSTAHLDTNLAPGLNGAQSRTDLISGAVDGPAPLANLAARTRHNVQASYEAREATFAGVRHTLALGAGWEQADIRNRFEAPSDLNLITANGAPAFIVALNTPLDSRERIQSVSGYAQDRVRLASWLAFDFGLTGDFLRGSVPAQSSPAGAYMPVRQIPSRADLISWKSVSPRAGFAISPRALRGLVFRGSYARQYATLAGRYLDFGNPNSLGGLEYQWIDHDGDGVYQQGEMGQLLRSFGGAYSSIDSHLKRPDSDGFNVGAEISLPRQSFAAVRLFRRDEKNRIAAIDTGVPMQAYRPVEVLDPGPDGMPGTSDDQQLTVYAQDPSTFGKDHYLLTNPPDLRMLNTGLLAETGSRWRGVQMHASFLAEKSYGPTNPGNTALENDSGVIGALFLDPNMSIHAAGRDYFDRAYVGKLQFTAQLPKVLGGATLVNAVNYLDGLVFGRRLLVTGLPQGPLLVATTVRGSPEGGNRAEYVLNWNLRLSRAIHAPHGNLRLILDVLNVSNASNRVQENDVSGPTFNQRLPVAIEAPRYLRLEVQYSF